MPKLVKENLSRMVKRVIKEKKLSLADVEERSGGKITKSYVSRIMTGNVQNITLEKLVALARGIDEDAHKLFAAYYGGPPPIWAEAQDVFEWGAGEFVEMMRIVVADSTLTEIVREATRLWPEEYQVALRFLAELNEGKKPKKNMPNSKVNG